MLKARLFLVIIAIVLVISAANFHNFYNNDACGNLATADSLSKDLDLDLRNQTELCGNSWNGAISLGVHNEWFSVHEIALPVLTFPIYAIGGAQALLVFNLCLLAVAFYTLSSINSGMISPTVSIITALAIFTSQPLRSLAISYSNDFFAASLLVLATYFIWNDKKYLGGIIWGIAFISRIHVFIHFPAFLLFCVFLAKKSKWEIKPVLRSVISFTLGICTTLPVFFLQNILLFGSPLVTSYHRRINFTPEGYHLDSPADSIISPNISQLFHILFNADDGLFFVQFFFLISWIIGSFLLVGRHKAILILTSTGLVVSCLFYSAYPDLHYPARYFLFYFYITFIPLSLIVDKLVTHFHQRYSHIE